MCVSCEQEDFRTVADGIKKYESYPDDTRDSWEALQRSHDKMVEEAKDKMLKLCEAETPSEIDDALGAFAV
jgi:hypothetical protein